MASRVLLLIVVTLPASISTVVNPFRVLRSAADTVASPDPIVIVKALLPFASSNGVLSSRRSLKSVAAIVAVTTPVVNPSRLLA